MSDTQSDDNDLCVTMTPVRRPHVDTEKSRYAVESSVAFETDASLRFGFSSTSKMAGHDFKSTDDEASRDLINLMMLCTDIKTTDFDTSTIIFTVGSVVIRF